MKTLVFNRLIYESAVSAWTAASPFKADTDYLDCCVLHYVRNMLGKRALWAEPISQPTAGAPTASEPQYRSRHAEPEAAEARYRKVTDASVWALIQTLPCRD